MAAITAPDKIKIAATINPNFANAAPVVSSAACPSALVPCPLSLNLLATSGNVVTNSINNVIMSPAGVNVLPLIQAGNPRLVKILVNDNTETNAKTVDEKIKTLTSFG